MDSCAIITIVRRARGLDCYNILVIYQHGSKSNRRDKLLVPDLYGPKENVEWEINESI